MSSSDDEEIQPVLKPNEIVAHLKFIGCVHEGEIINVSNKTISQKGIWTSICRTFSPLDNRHQTLAYIRKIVKNAMDLAEQYIVERKEEPYKDDLLQNLLKDLERVQQSILLLARTYRDPMFSSEIGTIREEIQAKITDFERRINKI